MVRDRLAPHGGRFRLLLAAMALAAVLSGCTSGSDENGRNGSASATATPPGTEQQEPQVVSGEVAGGRIEARVQPLVRSGNAVVLTVETEATSGELALGSAFADPSRVGETGVTELRLVDSAAGAVHTVAEDAQGKCVCTQGVLELGPGATATVQAVFAAPAADVDAMSVLLPHLPVVAEVPVIEGDVPIPTPSSTQAADAPALDLAAVARAPVASLETYSEQLGGQVRTRTDPETVTVSVDTDVLFALDSAQLSPDAQAALDAAAGQVLAAGAGELSITGHTDSTGEDAYNLDLSQRRAQAVADALAGRLPPDRYPTTVTGRGESEPAVPNDSEAGRALNRRVELVLSATTDGATVTQPDVGALPPPPPAVGRGPDGVEVAARSGNLSYRVVASQARRIESALVVELEVTPLSGDGGVIGGLLSTGPYGSRAAFDPLNQYASNGVRLLQGAQATYPLDYVIGEGRDGTPERTCLCDRWLNQEVPVGETAIVPVWLPDPGSDPATVTLDVKDLLRLTDVPVT